MISPTHVRVSEIKTQLKTSNIQDLIGVRDHQRTTFVLLADDESLKILITDMEKCNSSLNQSSKKKKSFPPVEFDLSEDKLDYDTFPCHTILSDQEADDRQQQPPTNKRRKPTITNSTTSAATDS